MQIWSIFFEVGTEMLNISRIPVSLKSSIVVIFLKLKWRQKKWFKLKHTALPYWLDEAEYWISTEFVPFLSSLKMLQNVHP